jgi:phage host-nuclease inhibitor protein Gam
MATPRRKTAALDAPQSTEAATLLIGSYAEVITGIEEMRAAADHAIAQIEANRDAQIAPLDIEAKDLFRQLSRWWSVASDDVTGGVRKSVIIAGCMIGIRTATPSLKLPSGMNETGLLNWLLAQASAGARWAEVCIRRTEKIDKQTIIKVLRLDAPSMATMALKDHGLDTKQPEQFFIDRIVKPATDDPEMIENGEGTLQ